MAYLSDINWRPVDASIEDKDFLKKFIQTSGNSMLFKYEIPIISGEKGSGKTAICKYITNSASNDYDSVSKISFNDLEFGLIVENLSIISDISQISAMTIMSNYWQYVILMTVMQDYFEKNKINLTLSETRIVEYLRKENFLDEGVLTTFMRLVKNTYNFLDSVTDPKAPISPIPSLSQDVDEKVIDKIQKFPVMAKDFSSVVDDFFKVLSNKQHNCFIYLDEFDKLRVHDGLNPNSLALIFEGLVDAVYQLHTSNHIGTRVSIKAMIPHDKWVRMNLRDMDKIRAMHKSIRWNYKDFEDLINQRILISDFYKKDNEDKRNYPSFNHVWTSFFPSPIKNEKYSIYEEVYDYIVRHTLYRPRQLQYHFIHISDFFSGRNIQAKDIPRILEESCQERVIDFIAEYHTEFPDLKNFLGRFSGVCNVIKFDELLNITANHLDTQKIPKEFTKEWVDQLYSMGFFGWIKFLDEFQVEPKRRYEYIPPTKFEDKSYVCQFYYKKHLSNISSHLDGENLICIHPMFYDYCNQVPHESILVG